MTPAIKEPLWQRIQNLEAVVTEMANKPNTIPPEKEDILQESLSRIKCIEYDLQKTKKVVPIYHNCSLWVSCLEILQYCVDWVFCSC